MSLYSATTICDMLKQRGIETIVEHTGGGNFAIATGPLCLAEPPDEFVVRYVVKAGPLYDWDLDMTEAFLGPDNDNEDDSEVQLPTDLTIEQVVDRIVELHNKILPTLTPSTIPTPQSWA